MLYLKQQTPHPSLAVAGLAVSTSDAVLRLSAGCLSHDLCHGRTGDMGEQGENRGQTTVLGENRGQTTVFVSIIVVCPLFACPLFAARLTRITVSTRDQ